MKYRLERRAGVDVLIGPRSRGRGEWVTTASLIEAELYREREKLRAEVRDLRARLRDRDARLKAARKAAQADEPWMDSVPTIERVTDLRNKNWRRP